MNLHEECLLKYLSNPLCIVNSTDLLKLSNTLIEKGKLDRLVKSGKLNYTAVRI